MEPTSVLLIITAIGIAAVSLLAWKLVEAIWYGKRLQPIPIGAPAVVALLAGTLLSLGNAAAPEPTLVAGVATYRGAEIYPGTEPRQSACEARLMNRGSMQEEHIALVGALREANRCAIWAVIEDPRTGVYWLQGPARTDTTTWNLDLVIGTGTRPPGDYRVTVFAVDAATSSGWEEAARDPGAWLALGSLPPALTWLAPPFLVAG